MSANQTNGDIAAMTFEQAVRELEGIVTALERGDVPLDQSSRNTCARRGAEEPFARRCWGPPKRGSRRYGSIVASLPAPNRSIRPESFNGSAWHSFLRPAASADHRALHPAQHGAQCVDSRIAGGRQKAILRTWSSIFQSAVVAREK